MLAAFLEAQGYSVWWDADLEGGDKYRATITAELSKARAVVVIWTKNSVGSDWVQSEAGRGLNERKLIPVRSAGVEYKDIPPPFDNVHTLTLNNREQILAAVAGQLAKPAEPAPRWKVLKFEVLAWLGVVGGAITLVTNVGGIVKLSNFFHWLLSNWSPLLKYAWQALSFFKFDVSVYDAEMLTILLLMTSAVFYSSFRQPISPVRKSFWKRLLPFGFDPLDWSSWVQWYSLTPPLILIGVILIAGAVSIDRKQKAKLKPEYDAYIEKIFANNPECMSFMKGIRFGILDIGPALGSQQTERVSQCFNSSGVKQEDVDHFIAELSKERDKSIWLATASKAAAAGTTADKEAEQFATLLALAQIPIFLPFLLYWVASFIFPLNLQYSVLRRRLWRTLMVFGGIIVMNYVAVGMESGGKWLKTIPDLN